MKSTVRATLLLAALLVPVWAFAQSPGFPIPAVPTGGWSYSGFQGYFGGVSAMFGGGGIYGGIGWGLGGFGAGGFGVAGIAITIVNIINRVLVPLLFAVSFIVFLYGVAKAYILSPGDEDAIKSGHKIILWGLIGFATMVSVWGLVNVVVNTFGLAGPIESAIPPAPK